LEDDDSVNQEENSSLDEDRLEEHYTTLISQIQDPKIEDLSDWITNIKSYIEKDEGHAIKVANSLLTIIRENKKDRVKGNSIQVFFGCAFSFWGFVNTYSLGS